MDFPTIHTNFWDAVIAVPVVLILTQLIKMLIKPSKSFWSALDGIVKTSLRYPWNK